MVLEVQEYYTDYVHILLCVSIFLTAVTASKRVALYKSWGTVAIVQFDVLPAVKICWKVSYKFHLTDKEKEAKNW